MRSGPPRSSRANRDLPVRGAPQASFADRLIRWQHRHGRHDLPWQHTQDPYRVWLSEIMLQQTQVATVIPYYERFLRRFPTLADLAAAPLAEVMALWSGLGYYARARNLHRCALALTGEHGGLFPSDPERLAALPGIGRSTANSIATFCFGAQVPILDGNARRVLCRAFGIEGWPGSGPVEKRLWVLAGELMPGRDGAAYNQAQMDLGAMVCTRARPDCDACPLRDVCVARQTGRVAELPARKAARRAPERTATLLVVLDGRRRVLLETRPPAGIWGGLQSLPELPEGTDAAVWLARHLGGRVDAVVPAPTFVHAFSHFRLRVVPLLCRVTAARAVAERGWHWLLPEQLATAALPAPVRMLLAKVLPVQPADSKSLSSRKR